MVLVLVQAQVQAQVQGPGPGPSLGPGPGQSPGPGPGPAQLPYRGRESAMAPFPDGTLFKNSREQCFFAVVSLRCQTVGRVTPCRVERHNCHSTAFQYLLRVSFPFL